MTKYLDITGLKTLWGKVKAADKALQESIDAVNKSGSNTNYVTNITVTQGSGHPTFVRFTVQKGGSQQYSIDIANATTTVQGLMSADDKAKLDAVDTTAYVAALAYNTSTRNITASNGAGTAVSTINIPLVTSSRPGLMTIADKAKLDAYPAYADLADTITALTERVAALEA